MVFVSIRNEYANRVRLAVQLKDEVEVHKMVQNVGHALSPLHSWCMANNGKCISDELSHVVFEVPASALTDLERLVNQFKDHTKLDAFAGVGNTVDEAERASEIAEHKYLDHPLLMTEELDESSESTYVPPETDDMSKSEIVSSPRLSKHVSEFEPLDKNAKSAIRNALRGLGAAALLASRGHAPAPAPVAQAPVVEAPKEAAPEYKPSPQKFHKPVRQENPYYRHTFLEEYNPQTVHHGMHDGMWAIVHSESRGGKSMDHGDGYNEKTGKYSPELHRIFVPTKRNLKDSDREVRDNRAFGPYGMRPYTAMDTYHKNLNGTKDKMGHGDLTEQEFIRKFRTDVGFHNELVKQHVDHLVKKFGPQMRVKEDPLIPFRAFHHGDQKGALPHVLGEKPSDYDPLILRSINQGLKAGREFDFTEMYGNDAFGKRMSDKLIQKARDFAPLPVAKQPKTKVVTST
jgi:hypothetical protein